MKTLELVVPCYNESDVLELFYNEVAPVLTAIDGFECRFIFVDDGSADNTLNIIKDLAKKDARVQYISFSRNFGKEAAMLAGLRYSTADFVGIMDADLQHSPDMIPEMLMAVDADEYDVAAAKRSDRSGENKIKSLLSNSFYSFSNRLTEVEIDSGAQDFRIMKRKVVEAILSMTEYNRFTKGIFSFVGFKTKWFEHENRVRAAGETKWNIVKLFKYALDGIVAFSNAPLRIPLFCGALFALIGSVYAIVWLILRLAINKMTSPVHPIVAVMLILSGIIMLCLGVMGEYLARIYSEAKGRPVFIVSETNIKKTSKNKTD